MLSKDRKQTIHLPYLLLPKKQIDLSKWAVVACDQFTSQPSYWKELKSYIDDAPSTYNMVLPEVYLEEMGDDTINNINRSIDLYLSSNILEDIGPSMMLIERKTTLNSRRLGLLMAIDLEDYDYVQGSKPLIRTTEETIVERIPPRMKIRENAPLELSHVMLLMDDSKLNIINRLFLKRHEFKKRYDFVLNMMGGHIRGYQIEECDEIIEEFYSLIEQEDPILFVVGDGNHSLATAKAHWESIKKTSNPDQLSNHPARYTLVEVVNIYDQGLYFEGIHRVLFNVNSTFLVDMFNAVDKEEETWVYTKQNGMTPFYIPKSTAIAYEQVQSFIDDYLLHHPEVSIDYIHGDQELIDICNIHENSIGIKMPVLDRKDFISFIHSGKILPRKSFSMGSATAKRYYLESRMIIQTNQKEKK